MRALVAFVAVLALGGCGGTDSRPQSTSLPASESTDIASANPQVQYFHQQLVDNGENLESAFGSDLSALGMNPRDLQQDDPQHAYDTVLEKVRGVADAASRREMMRTFFNRDD